MSNPGVVTLLEKEISPTKSFRVEDNLGEAIHFHYNDIRIDLKIEEFLYIAGLCDRTIYELVKAENFDLDDFEENFLNEYSQCLMDLTRVDEKKIPVKDVYYQDTNLLHLPIRRKINRTRARKLVENARKRRASYRPVLFNDNTTVMYGISQIADAYLENPDTECSVLVMHFDKDRHSVPNHPWIPFLFKWNKKRMIKVAKKLAMKVFK